MISRFADTSFYVAILNTRDTWHSLAVHCSRQFRGLLVTTDFVLIELGNWLSRSGDRSAFVRFLAQLRSDPKTVIFPATRNAFDQGFDLYERRSDKSWSLTDCISFAIMQQEGLTEALTADHHFEQAGFTILLRKP
jgi:predicted nucleic acid-binding protein